MTPGSGQRSLSKQTLLAFVVAVLAIVLRLNFLSGAFLSNAAWLQLARANTFGATRETWITRALNLFQRAVTIDASSHITFLGAGMAHVVADDEVAALSSWQKAEVPPQVLVGFGDQAKVGQKWNDALFYYKGAASLEPGQPNEGRFLAASVCQLTFAQLDVLSQPNQAYCQDYFSQNGDNLIINGQFEEGDTLGWSAYYPSSPTLAIYEADETTGKDAPAAFIEGLTEGYHGGLYQTVTLPSGTIVRYSAWIKIQSEGETSARLLYFGGQMDGKPMGNVFRTVPNDIEWTYLERTFQVPEIDGSILRLFPALLTGKGIVWIDDVRLEVLPEN